YVHKMIEHKWDITVPYNPTLSNVKSMANMKYLLTAIDVANEILNGEKTTDYGNGEFATLQAADTTATNTAVETLIKEEIEYEFFLTTTSTNSFSFKISAAGKFYVDWGDGKTETITKPDTTNTTYSHTYSTSKSYTIKLTGQATAYSTSSSTAAITFSSSASKIALIDGSIGAIFGTLSSDTNNQPRFYQTFYNATNMTGSIPSDLFAGISGAPAPLMFYSTFYGCSGLTGTIPAGLFGNLTGAPAFAMFYSTFYGCSGLTGEIPDGLFGNLTGAPANSMFANTFYGCSGLTGTIPDGLFGNLSGAPAILMFSSTFYGCSGLTSIPENLFGNISGTAQRSMFFQTFYNCTSLTGPSAKINGKYIYEIWPETDQYGNAFMYANCKKLSDYMYIPTVYGGMGGTNIEYVSAPDNVDYKFFVTTIPDVELFMISIAAAGEFYIDWGDGAMQKITKNDTEKYNIGHKYANSGKYTIGIGGQATAYNTVTNISSEKESTVIINYRIVVIEGYTSDSDYSLDFIESIDGSLGAIFGTLADGSQPSFENTFSKATNMIGSIPINLFEGISGTIRDYMFRSTFANCTSLTGPSARINGQYLYEIWPSATSYQVGGMYSGATGLSDYSSIPTYWK
ncbi:MAG: PKD domain-containing protein, partial [Alphaproteobacteria bacterium]|nr:PKD domain-containing protein [Alphaproteobacteria bacterium]